MNELLKINYDAEQPTVSARDLHEGLEIGTQYTKWFERMCEYGFAENADYRAISQMMYGVWCAHHAPIGT